MFVRNSFIAVVCSFLSVGSKTTPLTTAIMLHNSDKGQGNTLNEDLADKTITFIRHGCTYMNEYLGGADGGRPFGSPGFTDIFVTTQQQERYKDSSLSARGQQQVASMAKERHAFVDHCELMVVSPLTRALQTFDLGLKPQFSNKNNVPIIALPEAAERLYLISDVGREIATLQVDFSYVDFETGFVNHSPKHWWYQPDDKYVEWRPVGRGQQYACPGEPLDAFYRRMNRFYTWLAKRSERHIAVVCHHGVIDAFLDCDFDNCQYQSVKFTSMRPRF